jgi:hypothetical protein
MYGAHVRHTGHVGIIESCVKKDGQPDYKNSANDNNTAAENRISGGLHALRSRFSYVEPLFIDAT